MTESGTLPVPLDPLLEDVEDRRLWIGNLDPRITDLVKLLQTYGPLEKFDMLFHRSGPLEGQPRGYAFVTFTSKQVAENAKRHMDGMMVGSKSLCVKWAHCVPKDSLDKQKTVPEILALGGSKTVTKLSRLNAIKAIEEKLKVMESTSEASDFKITDTPSISQIKSVQTEEVKPTRSKHATKAKSKPYLKTKWKT